MIRRNTWYIIAIFAILSALTLYLQQNHRLGVESTSTPAPTRASLLGQNAVVSGFQMSDSSGKVIKVSKNEQGLWQVDLPSGSASDQGTIEATISQLQSILPLATLPTPPPVSSTGLDKPAYTLQITLADGSTAQLLIGSKTSTDSGYYTQLSGRNVQVIEYYSLESIFSLYQSLLNPVTPTATIQIPASSTDISQGAVPASSVATETPTP
jgi:hypothetical protein